MKFTDLEQHKDAVYKAKQEIADAVFMSIDAEEGLTASGELGGKFVIPVLIPEGTPSGDGRTFKKDSITTKEMPIPLLWQVFTDKGHTGSAVIGRIDSVDRLESGGLGNAVGYFDTGEYGREAQRLVENGFLQGISADLDNFEASIELDEPEGQSEASVSDGETPADLKKKITKARETIKNDKITVEKSRLIAATLVAKPAFSEAYITMADEQENVEEDLTDIPDGEYEEEPQDIESMSAALVASAIPVVPPRDWFNNPDLSTPTPITVTDDGQVFGHIATWDSSHIGLPGNTRPPRSRSEYAYFRTGVVRTDDGTDMPVGQLTLVGGHAPLSAGAAAAVKHYDDTASAIADVSVGEDSQGIWVAGALRPEARPEQIRALRASAPSGDWRPINGRLELVAVCQVNVPGFPVARAMIASGQVSALVAAGTHVLSSIRKSQLENLDDMSARIDQLEQQLFGEKHKELSSHLKDFASSVGYKFADERRTDAISRLKSFASEMAEMSHKEKENDSLVASAEKARKRIERLRDM